MTRRDLELLNSMSYVLECGVLGYNGELKFELDKLCSDLDEIDQCVPSMEARSMLRNAHAFYRGDDYRKGASELARASRTWWRELLK